MANRALIINLLLLSLITGGHSDLIFYYENKCSYPVWLAARPSIGDSDPERGDCGSGIKECQYPPPALLVTLLNFEIKLPVVSYEVSLKHGHNVPVRIRPDGGSLVGGAGPCPVVDCGQVTTCRSMANKDGRYIGCYSDNDPPTYKCSGATRYNITFCPI
ncbi:hypothetical protein SLA2020_414100 [Shorea laevis]